MTATLAAVLPFVAAVGLFAWAGWRTFDNIDQDAWIYFTFFKRFFELPFSFQPGHVSYGATSPLHVMAMAPLFHAGGENWLVVARGANFALVFTSLVLVHRAARADPWLLPMLVALSLAFGPLYQTTAALFETGVTYLCVSLLILFVSRRRAAAAMFVAGVLPLARPELLLVSAATVALLASAGERNRLLRLLPLAIAPAALYLLYMWWSGAGLVPTSIVGRAIIAREYSASWFDSFRLVFEAPAVLPYLVMSAVAIAAATVRPAAMWPAWIVIVPIAGLYLLRPPAPSYMARYLLPLVPALLYAAAVLVQACWSAVVRGSRLRPGPARRTLAASASAVSLGLASVLMPPGPAFAAYTPDMILQKDLAAAVSAFVGARDRVLMYEIQGQYHFPGHAISADGIVGSEAHAFLLRRESFDAFIDRVGLTYVVTFNAFNYRPIYKDTPLVALYEHDLSSVVGDEVCLGAHCFRKVATNPHFSSWYEERPVGGLNTGQTLRYYSGRLDPALRGHLIQWNSVYAIEDSAATPPEVPQA